MTEQHWSDCQHIMQTVVDEIKDRQLLFNGVLNAGFFITKEGVRFMEFNGRFGDPEALNILSIMHSPLSRLIKDMYHKTLSNDSVSFINKASVVKYLVAKEYPHASPEAIDFTIDPSVIESRGLHVFFSSAVHVSDHQYQTLKTSRVLAIGAVANSITEASDQVNAAIKQQITAALDYRSDIGSKENLNRLKNTFV
jgi:phosphoribosylamine--glycine ligase